jgi:hypothetical protein
LRRAGARVLPRCCGTCGKDELVAFSCKRRGFCPSCGARRMADLAAHLVDRVWPDVPVRQVPACAHLVGIVDVFDEIYSEQRVPIGVFDALRILAQAYRGCFEERVAMSFVRLFR